MYSPTCRRASTVLASICVLVLVQLAQELARGGHPLGLRADLDDCVRVDRHAHAADIGVHAERRFERVVGMSDVLERGRLHKLCVQIDGVSAVKEINL